MKTITATLSITYQNGSKLAYLRPWNGLGSKMVWILSLLSDNYQVAHHHVADEEALAGEIQVVVGR